MASDGNKPPGVTMGPGFPAAATFVGPVRVDAAGTLLHAARFPLQLPSLLFVAASSLVLAVVTLFSGVFMIFAIPALYMMLVWLTKFAFRMIDDVVEGRREASTATVEMLSPFGDERCWVHPALAAVVGLLAFALPPAPARALLAAAWFLFPASIGAIALSGRALDALNPLALWRVLRGLGTWYLLSLLVTVLCALLVAWVEQSVLWSVLRVALSELLLLECYALIGGTLYLRRFELGFIPAGSPEKELEKQEAERQSQRQRAFDDVYAQLRARQYPKAIAAAGSWLTPLSAADLQRDVAALLQASRAWSEPRGFGVLAQGLIAQLLAMGQPALALDAAQEALGQASSFAPARADEAVALARAALQARRIALARLLVQNQLAQSRNAPPDPELLALQRRLLEGTAR